MKRQVTNLWLIESIEKTSFYAKDNITIFSHACQDMGIHKNDCLNPSMFENGEVGLDAVQ